MSTWYSHLLNTCIGNQHNVDKNYNLNMQRSWNLAQELNYYNLLAYPDIFPTPAIQLHLRLFPHCMIQGRNYINNLAERVREMNKQLEPVRQVFRGKGTSTFFGDQRHKLTYRKLVVRLVIAMTSAKLASMQTVDHIKLTTSNVNLLSLNNPHLSLFHSFFLTSHENKKNKKNKKNGHLLQKCKYILQSEKFQDLYNPNIDFFLNTLIEANATNATHSTNYITNDIHTVNLKQNVQIPLPGSSIDTHSSPVSSICIPCTTINNTVDVGTTKHTFPTVVNKTTCNNIPTKVEVAPHNFQNDVMYLTHQLALEKQKYNKLIQKIKQLSKL